MEYKDLEIEIGKCSTLKITTVLVIVGALGMTQKGTDERINKIPGNLILNEIQNISTLWNGSSL